MRTLGQDDKCYCCDRPFRKGSAPHHAMTSDRSLVYVGPDCAKKITEAGVQGYQHPSGGPKLFLERFLP